MRRRSCGAAALLLALAGCSAGTSAGPPELQAQVQQYRADIARERLAVALTNEGDEPVVVTGLRLAASGFHALPTADQDVELAPGTRTDLRVPLGTARCGRQISGPDHAVATVRTVDGAAHEMALSIPVGNGLLERLRRRACDERALRAAVDLRLSPSWQRTGLQLRGELLLQRQQGAAPVTVVEPGGNILFTIRTVPRALPMGVLPAGQDAVALPMSITTTRCDGHALAESKRSYIFLFFVSLGDAEPHRTAVTADPPLQRQLDRLALDTCRPGG